MGGRMRGQSLKVFLAKDIGVRSWVNWWLRGKNFKACEKQERKRKKIIVSLGSVEIHGSRCVCECGIFCEYAGLGIQRWGKNEFWVIFVQEADDCLDGPGFQPTMAGGLSWVVYRAVGRDGGSPKPDQSLGTSSHRTLLPHPEGARGQLSKSSSPRRRQQTRSVAARESC